MFESSQPSEQLAIMIWLRQAMNEQHPTCEEYSVHDLLIKSELRAFLLNLLMR